MTEKGKAELKVGNVEKARTLFLHSTEQLPFHLAPARSRFKNRTGKFLSLI